MAPLAEENAKKSAVLFWFQNKVLVMAWKIRYNTE